MLPLGALVLTMTIAGGNGVDVAVELLPIEPPGGKSANLCRVAAAPVGGRTELVQKASPQEIQCPALPGMVTFQLEPGLMWEFTLESDAYWAASEAVQVNDPARRVEMKLWPVAAITGTLEVPKAESAPTVIRARFQSVGPTNSGQQKLVPPPATGGPEGEVACPVTTSVFTCTVPIGTLDLRLRASSFVSRYLWRQTVMAGESRDLGTWALVPGAEVAGRVIIAETGLPAKPTRITAVPVRGAVPDSGDLAQRRMSTSITRSNEYGFFVVEGLEPGSYTLTATAAGFAPACLGPVTIVERSLTELRDPLALHRPLALHVSVSPRQPPGGSPWTMEIKESSVSPGLWQTRTKASVSPEGLVTFPDLPPGTFRLVLYDDSGMVMLVQKHELTESTTSLELSVPIILVMGTVRIGERPLQCRLTFSRRDTGATVDVESNLQGEFFTNLAGDGSWSVRVTATHPTVKRVLRDVRFAADETGAATIELRLPATLVEGTVVWGDNTRVARAEVRLVQPSDWSDNAQTLTDDEGRFSIEGAPEGKFEVFAQHRDPSGTASTDHVSLDLTGGKAPPPVKLVLRPDNEIAGRIVSHYGQGVPRAIVFAYSTDLLQALAVPLERAVTDADGRFRLRVPFAVNSVYVAALAPGFSLRAVRRVLSDRAPLEIHVDPFGGVLKLDLNPVMEKVATGEVTFMVFQNEAMVPQALLFTWLRSQGQGWTDSAPLWIPMMGMGSYQFCVTDLSQVLGRAPRAPGGSEVCSVGTLASGAELLLTVAPRS